MPLDAFNELQGMQIEAVSESMAHLSTNIMYIMFYDCIAHKATKVQLPQQQKQIQQRQTVHSCATMFNLMCVCVCVYVYICVIEGVYILGRHKMFCLLLPQMS